MQTETELTGEELMTVREAAKLLRVDPSTVRLWACKGFRTEAGELLILKRVRVGRSVRFKRESLADFVAACSR